MYTFPQGSKKLSETVKRYERALQAEKRKFGTIDDGFGKRYLLGTLYLLMGDVPGAMKSFDWFAKEFSDDIGEPFHVLSWTLALYKSGRLEEASKKLRQTMVLNLYVIPRLLGEEQSRLDIWHDSNRSEKRYLDEVSSDVFALWDRESLDWVRSTYHTPEFQAVRERFIEIQRELQHEPVGPKRSRLVDEAIHLERGDLRHIKRGH